MTENADTGKLWEEIRDLLRPIADHYWVEYEKRQALMERMKKVINTDARLVMCKAVLKGVGAQQKIADIAGVTQPSVSGFISAMKEAGLLAIEEEGGEETLVSTFSEDDLLYFERRIAKGGRQ